MRQGTLLRWMAEVVARQVRQTALGARAPTPRGHSTAAGAAAQLLPRLHSWFAARHPMGWPVVEPQPVLVRRSDWHQPRRRDDDEDHSCYW